MKTLSMAPGPDADRVAQAWDWVLRLRADDLPREELTGWMSWYEADERNKQAFEEASALWQQADRVTALPDPLPRAAWQAAAPRWTGRLVALAAGVVVAVGAALVILLRPQPETPALVLAPAPAPAAPVTALVRETQLPDGSRVELAANSSVTVDYTDDLRLLTMQTGVAHFTVAHSRTRPFVVRVGRLQVRAVGTAFNIRHASDRVIVTVTEGTVDVSADANDSAGRSIRLGAGREITWGAHAAGPTIASVDPARALAWREGRLDYLNEPLASAIADINRYARRRIIVRDAAVGGILFSGTVLIDQTDEWVQALPRLFPVDVHTDDAGNIVLTARRA